MRQIEWSDIIIFKRQKCPRCDVDSLVLTNVEYGRNEGFYHMWAKLYCGKCNTEFNACPVAEKSHSKCLHKAKHFITLYELSQHSLK